ncbi:MAG: MBL fold metallo-hydrolase [Chloroflexota bacterium]
MQILPGVHQLRQDMTPAFPGAWTAVTLVEGEHLAVIDTGMPNAAETLILPYLRRLGRSPADLRYIALTHAHADHFGGNESLKRASGASILVHESEGAILERPLWWLNQELRPGPADRLLRDGDTLELGGRHLQVVHLPGHTPGCCGYYLSDQATLIAGDALQGLGTRFQHLPFYGDPDAYESSLRTALEMRIDHLLLSHAYLPQSKSFLSGPEVRLFLEAGLEVTLGLDRLLLRELTAAQRPLNTTALTERACELFGQGGATALAAATVGAHLHRLVAMGELFTWSAGDEEIFELR